MKTLKIYLVVPICLLFGKSIIAQDLGQNDFAPIGAKWYYDELAGMGWSPYVVDYILYTSEKDTIINGQECRKIIKRHDIDCFFRPKNEFVYSRHDSVFFYDEKIDTFQLLYNFNAEAGDNWSFLYSDIGEPGIDTLNVHVDSIGSLNANNQILRLLYVTNTAHLSAGYKRQYQARIAEKTGDLFFMFNFDHFSNLVCDGNLSRGLRCYEDSDIGSYHIPGMEACDYTLLWTDIESDRVTDITIYPNPVGESICISGINEIAGFKIYNISGKLILSGTVKDCLIKTNDLDKGIYLLRIFDSGNNLMYSDKIIKQ